jgi:hypothetical protein
MIADKEETKDVKKEKQSNEPSEHQPKDQFSQSDEPFVKPQDWVDHASMQTTIQTKLTPFIEPEDLN